MDAKVREALSYIERKLAYAELVGDSHADCIHALHLHTIVDRIATLQREREDAAVRIRDAIGHLEDALAIGCGKAEVDVIAAYDTLALTRQPQPTINPQEIDSKLIVSHPPEPPACGGATTKLVELEEHAGHLNWCADTLRKCGYPVAANALDEAATLLRSIRPASSAALSAANEALRVDGELRK